MRGASHGLPERSSSRAHSPPLFASSPSSTILDSWTDAGIGGFLSQLLPNTNVKNDDKDNVVRKFVNAVNSQEIDQAMECFTDDVQYEFMNFAGPLDRNGLERHLRLSTTMLVLDDIITDGKATAAMQFHYECSPELRRHAFFQLDNDSGRIRKVYDFGEPTQKRGTADLAVLSQVSKILDKGADQQEDMSTIASGTRTAQASSSSSLTAPERYYAAWNERDIEMAAQVFTPDCTYDDTAFQTPFASREALQAHLQLCADALPDTFQFLKDDLCVAAGNNGKKKIAVLWHVDNEGQQMPFTRGCSFYEVIGEKNKGGLIQTGVDLLEPAVTKTGGLDLFLSTFSSQLQREPVRWIPTVLWATYMYVVFVSDGILPGANALQFEGRTWEEVFNLSLNFFFVSPALHLPFSPVVHPILEGVFNLLLSWAALFAGFLSDERPKKPNLLYMLPVVIGMQFLTSAFLLPYLATRTNEEQDAGVTKEDLFYPLAESRVLGPVLGSVGALALWWGAFARFDMFGDWSTRVSSFWELMSIDRVGSSFLVDLAIFALFQGWLVDDDLKRRGVGGADQGSATLRFIAKYVPFFGLAIYMSLRPAFPSKEKDSEQDVSG